MKTSSHVTGLRIAAIILQDHKRLPARFFAVNSGAILARGR